MNCPPPVRLPHRSESSAGSGPSLRPDGLSPPERKVRCACALRPAGRAGRGAGSCIAGREAVGTKCRLHRCGKRAGRGHGDQPHHDEIVGRDAFRFATATIQRLLGAGIATSVQTTIVTRTQGNVLLLPEKANTTGVGFVYQPTFISGGLGKLVLTADFWSIREKNVIGILGAQNQINYDLLLRLTGSEQAYRTANAEEFTRPERRVIRYAVFGERTADKTCSLAVLGAGEAMGENRPAARCSLRGF